MPATRNRRTAYPNTRRNQARRIPQQQNQPRKLALLIAAALAVVVVALLSLRACSGATQTDEPSPFYDGDNFALTDGRYTYTDESGSATTTGIDVSDHQGWINWQAVKNDGIDFAYIRAGYRGSTEGALYQDDYFAYNMASAKEAGIKRGVYFFSQATTPAEAREEARFVLGLLGGEKLDYPIAFDLEAHAAGVESRTLELDSKQLSQIALDFCDAIRQGGYEACIYGNGYDLGRYHPSVVNSWPIWYAEYGALPSYTNKFFIWQYSNEGTVLGIDTPVDLNLDLSAVIGN